jgi:hypothetical protein
VPEASGMRARNYSLSSGLRRDLAMIEAPMATRLDQRRGPESSSGKSLGRVVGYADIASKRACPTTPLAHLVGLAPRVNPWLRQFRIGTSEALYCD